MMFPPLPRAFADSHRRLYCILGAWLILLAAPVPMPAATVWNESVNGDISGKRLAPTAVPLSAGDNDVLGAVQGNPSDLDYLTINVPVGDLLSKIILKSFVSTDTRGFIGIQAGTTFTEPTAGTNVAHLLGYTHFGPGAGNVGADILPSMGVGPGAIGFTAALAAGSYTFWIQQLGAATSYDFDFQVSRVPEQTSWTLASLAAFCFAAIARGRGRK
jgi:hypothetical protein